MNDEIIQLNETEKAIEETRAYKDLVSVIGYQKLEKWVIGEIKRLNNLIYFCPIDEVEKYRSEARGMQNILDRVEKIINKKFE